MGNVLSPRKKATAPASALTNTVEATPDGVKTIEHKEDVGFRPTTSSKVSVDVIIPATPITSEPPSVTSVVLTVTETPSTEKATPPARETVASSATEGVAPSVTETIASSATEGVTPFMTETIALSATEAVADIAVPSVTMPEIDFSPFFTDFNSPFVGDVTYLSTMVSAPIPSIANSPPISPLLIRTYATAPTDDSIHINMDDVD